MSELVFTKLAIILLGFLFVFLNLNFLLEALVDEDSSDRALARGVFIGYLLVALALLVRVLWDYLGLTGGS